MGRPVRYRYETDATANDSSKVWTVPDGELWVITHISANCTATATAGNRRLRVIARDTADNIYVQAEAATTFAATETQHADFFPGAPEATAEVNDTLRVPMPVLILLPGHDLVVEDGAGVDAAADDLTVNFVYSVHAP